MKLIALLTFLLATVIVSQGETIALDSEPAPPTFYISEVDFVVSDSEVETNHANILLQDLNEGSGGKYIYAVKDWTIDPDFAITEFSFVQDSVCPADFTRLEQDLNQGAGGTYNYLCIKRGGGDLPKVIDIDVRSYEHEVSNTTVVDGWTLLPSDLNADSRIDGKFIYLLYKTQ